MMKIAVVTGAEGFIGSNLVRFLQGKNWRVIGLHLQDVPVSFPKLSNVTLLRCDLRNGQRITQILAKYQPTHVFHLAAQSLPTVSWEDPVRTFEANVMGSLYLFEAVRHMRRPPIVVSACSSAEYGHVRDSDMPVTEDHPLRPLHPYGISKVCLDLLAREYCLDFKIPAVNVRLFNTTGPGKTSDAPSDFVRQLARIQKGQQAPVVEVGNLKPRRAFLDVHDVVRGFYLVAMKGKRGESYNMCGTQTYRMAEVLHTAIRLSRMKVEVRPVQRLMRPSDEKIIFGSTKKIRKDTGWNPMRSLEQTLKSMLDYWNTVS